jgi:hypothetical protein
MYHTNLNNQVFSKEKSLLLSDFVLDYSQTVNYNYLNSCTTLQRHVFNLINQFKHHPYIKLTNEFIALRVGCSVKTVTRATNKFHTDGFINKHQKNPYAPNSFYLNVPQSKRSLILDSYFSKPSPRTRTCVRDKRFIFRKKYEAGGKEMMNAVQKHLILSNRHDVRLKSMLDDTKIKSLLISEPIQKITSLLDLDDDEQFKLVAFTDEALEYALKYIDPVVRGHTKLKTPIRDKMGWLISFINANCIRNSIEVDWNWYYSLCDILGKDPKKVTNKQPLIVRFVQRRGIYAPWKKNQVVLNTAQERERLKQMVESCKLKLADPSKYFKYCMKEGIIFTEKELAQSLQKLEELNQENNDEKQEILYQNGTYGMATGSA